MDLNIHTNIHTYIQTNIHTNKHTYLHRHTSTALSWFFRPTIIYLLACLLLKTLLLLLLSRGYIPTTPKRMHPSIHPSTHSLTHSINQLTCPSFYSPAPSCNHAVVCYLALQKYTHHHHHHMQIYIESFALSLLCFQSTQSINQSIQQSISMSPTQASKTVGQAIEPPFRSSYLPTYLPTIILLSQKYLKKRDGQITYLPIDSYLHTYLPTCLPS